MLFALLCYVSNKILQGKSRKFLGLHILSSSVSLNDGHIAKGIWLLSFSSSFSESWIISFITSLFFLFYIFHHHFFFSSLLFATFFQPFQQPISSSSFSSSFRVWLAAIVHLVVTHPWSLQQHALKCIEHAVTTDPSWSFLILEELYHIMDHILHLTVSKIQ